METKFIYDHDAKTRWIVCDIIFYEESLSAINGNGGNALPVK